MSISLILEGGGTRGAYTAGVLDVLTENNIFFPTVYGVSAGACNALSYISKQQGRNRDIFLKYASDKRYCSFELLRKTGSIFGFDFIFGELSQVLLPFDYNEFYRSSMDYYAVTTDCETGKAYLINKSEIIKTQDFTPAIASSSLPMVSHIVEYNGHKLLDGGIAAPIPIEHAMKNGSAKNVVVLTRDQTYVKKNKSDFPKFLLKKRYKEYPNFLQAMAVRSEIYNAERELCQTEQDKGNAFVIQPSEPINISRYCTKPDKLKEVYDLGVADTKKSLQKLQQFIALNS